MSVSTFWIVMFLVVLLPLLLIMSTDIYIVIGIVCFGAAGIRLYLTAGNEKLDKGLEGQAVTKSAPEPVPSAINAPPAEDMLPLGAAAEVASLTAEDAATASFFAAAMEPGADGPLVAEGHVEAPVAATEPGVDSPLSGQPLPFPEGDAPLSMVEAEAAPTESERPAGHFHDLLTQGGHRAEHRHERLRASRQRQRITSES